MPSSTSSFDRTVPDLPWVRMAVIATAIIAAAAIGWELHVRSLGYGPTLNDTPDLWAQRRETVRPDSVVIIGDSRAWFDLDLDELERGLGKRPVQLALPGSCAYPILEHFATDPAFRGTVICSVVPGMFFAPGGFLLENSAKALDRYRAWSPAQRAGHALAMPLEEHIAFLKQEELTLPALLRRIQIPNRPNAQVMPPLPPYFNSTDRERRARMTPQAEQPGPLRDRISNGWVPLFTPPPPPTYVPLDVFQRQMGQAMESRMTNIVAAVGKIRSRGGQVIFVRFPFTKELKAHEDKMTPRAQIWDPMIKLTGAPGIYFEDFPELAGFDCPELSHLSAADSVEFTKRLVPHLKRAADSGGSAAAPKPTTGG